VERFFAQGNITRAGAQLLPQFLDKLAGIGPFAQRRDAQMKFLNTVQQVFTKCPCGDLCGKILMGGADQRKLTL
jgi:hypothetical protein